MRQIDVLYYGKTKNWQFGEAHPFTSECCNTRKPLNQILMLLAGLGRICCVLTANVAKFTGVTATASPNLPMNYWHFFCSFILDLWPQLFSTPLKLKQLNWSLSPTEQSELIRLHPQQLSLSYRGLTAICLQIKVAQWSLMSCVCECDQSLVASARILDSVWTRGRLLCYSPRCLAVCLNMLWFARVFFWCWSIN